MPRLPKTATSMEDGEPSLGRFVVDANAGGEGMVVEVKVGGWRVLLSADGSRSSKRSAALEYVADREPPEELVGRFGRVAGQRRAAARPARKSDSPTPKRKRGAEPDDDSDADGSDDAADDAAPAAAPGRTRQAPVQS
ncbi:hypothetical protein JL720_10664 [Aureococcus anophagefferens]|nr:hypothetical protein JL720_10664 [Aureococcus anophagefferens]